jgi:hypothetical protein
LAKLAGFQNLLLKAANLDSEVEVTSLLFFSRRNMAKTHRGTGIRHLYVDLNGNVHQGEYNNGRGTCPVCERTGVKVLYDREVGESTVKVCKRCNTAIGRGKLHHLVASA